MMSSIINKAGYLISNKYNNLKNAENLNTVQQALQEIKMLEGKILAQQNLLNKEVILNNLNKAEFKVFSQWGDDGIIQFLVDYLDIENKIFIEFGVENYNEANTRFLLMNNCWKGLVMDASAENINHIKTSNLYWQYQLEARESFISKNNINELIHSYLNGRQLGLLVIDIDGNDYWIWNVLQNINPEIVIVEYNSLFGFEKAITVPYKEDFDRNKAHYSNLYYGASLPALQHLANKKGYQLVACNNNGNNAFFVRNDKIKNLKALTVQQAYKEASFRESRNQNNKLTYLNFEAAQKLISGMPVFNIINEIEESF